MRSRQTGGKFEWMYILFALQIFLTSLQLFFQLIGMKQTNSKKDWFLSEEEFKLWTRLYRLKDSDGIKEVTLPRVRFLSLQNEKDRPVS